MTGKELIEALKRFPEDGVVLIEHEGKTRELSDIFYQTIIPYHLGDNFEVRLLTGKEVKP